MLGGWPLFSITIKEVKRQDMYNTLYYTYIHIVYTNTLYYVRTLYITHISMCSYTNIYTWHTRYMYTTYINMCIPKQYTLLHTRYTYITNINMYIWIHCITYTIYIHYIDILICVIPIYLPCHTRYTIQKCLCVYQYTLLHTRCKLQTLICGIPIYLT